MFCGTLHWWSIQDISDAIILTAISAQPSCRTHSTSNPSQKKTLTSHLYRIKLCCTVYGRLFNFISFMSARFAWLKSCRTLSGPNQHSQDTLLSRSGPRLPLATWGTFLPTAAMQLMPGTASMQPFRMGVTTSAGPTYTRPGSPDGAPASTENKGKAKREAIRSAFNANLDISEIVNRQKGPRWASKSRSLEAPAASEARLRSLTVLLIHALCRGFKVIEFLPQGVAKDRKNWVRPLNRPVYSRLGTHSMNIGAVEPL